MKKSLVKFENGICYEGEWKGENKDGMGTQTWPDGAKYIGNWENNQANGKGKFFHANGAFYEGFKLEIK